MKERNTTITISESTWKKLMSMKNIGETFDKIILDLINTKESKK